MRFQVGQPLSNPLRQTGRMKFKTCGWLTPFKGETIATFGVARLVRQLDGRHELIGGTPAHHAAAREWCALFAPQVVFSSTPQRGEMAAACETAS
jgi:hypothetical protein